MTQLPSSVPIIEVLRAFPAAFHNPIPWFDGMMDKHGDTVEVRPPSGSKLLLSRDPAIIKHVLQKDHRSFSKSTLQTEHIAQTLGQGLLTAEGDYWLRQRRLIQPGFHRQRLSGLVGLVQQVVEDFSERFEEAAGSAEPIDLSHMMMELTFLIVSRSLFAAAISPEEITRIENAVTKVQFWLIQTARRPWLKAWYRLNGVHKQMHALTGEMDEILIRIIKDRQRSGSKEEDLLDMLLEARYEDSGEGMNLKQLRDEALILFVAGHETTANALTWMLWLLDKHPEVRQKICEEAGEVLEKGESVPDFEQVQQLTYTLQTIQEGMRLYPPAWAIDRVALKDAEAAGYKIQKDRVLILFLQGAHRHPDYWDEPTKFKPERFAKDYQSGLEHSGPKQAYFPFGGGPRLCIGNHFALMEMQLVLAHLLRRFEFKAVSEEEPEVEPLITLRPKGGIKVRVTRKET